MGKKVAIGTLIGFVVLFLGGWLVYGILMKDAMANMVAAAGTCMNAEPSMLHITLATIAQALLLAAVIYRFGVNTFSRGLLTGGWVTLLIVLWYNIWFLGSFSWYSTTMMVTDTVVGTIMGAVAGGLIGWAYGKVK